MGTAASPSLTRSDFEALKAGLTMLDVYRARTGKDKSEIGLRAYYEAARRLGVVAADTGFEDFLVRMPAELFNEIMAADTGRDGLPNSVTPENGGEIEPASSGTTDTDLETSSS